MNKSFDMCPRQVPHKVWAAVNVDSVEPTVHMPDIGEEAEIATVCFRLASLGVSQPILLSQIESPPPTVR